MLLLLLVGNKSCIMHIMKQTVANCLEDEGQVRGLLEQVLKTHDIPAVAKYLQVNETTIRRWKMGQTSPLPYISGSLKELLKKSHKQKKKTKEFSFIDLFAGIGGIRQGFESAGGRCVFTSEWDEYAQKTYGVNFPSKELIYGDITTVDEKDIPDHDLLLAGFPCQPFSIAGVSKKNALGRAHGFADLTQGTLFFDIARIIAEKKPKAFVLENVKNLQSHDKGKTFSVIMQTLEHALGYHVQYRIIDGQHWVPQHRERIVIVGFREPSAFDLNAIQLPEKGKKRLDTILHKTDGTEKWLEHDGDKYFDHENRRVQPKYTLTDNLWRYLQKYAEKHRSLGNGFGFGLVGPMDIARTLSARYYKDGSEILIRQNGSENPRRLTPRECARLMGYGDDYIIPVSDTRAYKQFGNSVVVPVFRVVAKAIKPYLI